MTILLNGEPREIAPQQTVGDLLAQLQLQPQRLAVELNQQLLPRGEFARVCLSAGDQVEIVTLVGGG